MESGARCPLPEDPTLAAIAVAMNEAGQWAEIVDGDWRCLYLTDEVRLMYGGWSELAPYPVGSHYFGREAVTARMEWRGGQWPLEVNRQAFAIFGGYTLADTSGGREELRELVDPRLRDMVDDLIPAEAEAVTLPFQGLYTGATPGVRIFNTLVRVRDHTGRSVGRVNINKPAAGMATLMRIAAMSDPDHMARMNLVARAGRRPAAVLFGDLEASSLLARRLSTAGYFTLARRLVREADRCVIEAGGIVGRHAGDGFVGFFLAETAGSEAIAARSCIQASYAIKEALSALAHQSELSTEDLSIRFGLHWGATLYVGQIATIGRTEVNALGDEVNETARIEACASGGRVLASKALIERVDPQDLAALSIDVEHNPYTLLADLPTATEKARRDAPMIAVCELAKRL